MSKYYQPPTNYEIIRTDTYELVGYWFVKGSHWKWLDTDGVTNYKNKPFVVNKNGEFVNLQYRPWTGAVDKDGVRIYYLNTVQCPALGEKTGVVEWDAPRLNYEVAGPELSALERFKVLSWILDLRPGLTVTGRWVPPKPEKRKKQKYQYRIPMGGKRNK